MGAMQQRAPGKDYTVHGPLSFRKIIEIERFALQTAILHECQNYLGGGGSLGGSERSLPLKLQCPTPPPPPPTWYIGKTRWPSLMVRRAISQRSHEKMGTLNSLGKDNFPTFVPFEM